MLNLAGAIGVLTDLGVLPAIILAAVVGIAKMLYARFRK